jgi:hypothetical protein
MHRIESRTYVGQANEQVAIDTRVDGGGQATVIVNGVDMGRQARFTLPPNPGDRVKWQVALMGPLGATCVVDTRVVDGASDADFLICQTHNPGPVNFYTGSVAQAPAIRGLRGIRAAAPGPQARAAKRTRAKRSAAKKGGIRKKSTAKKTAAKKTAKKTVARRTAGKKRTRKGGRS